MLRIGSTIYKLRPLLLRHGNSVEIRVDTFSNSQVLLGKRKDVVIEREPCPVPPPPEVPPPKDDSAFWGTVAFCIMAGLFTAYAKDNKEIRDWLSIQAPWIDEFVSIVYEENCSIMESIGYKIDEFKEAFARWSAPLPPECYDDDTGPAALPPPQNVANEIVDTDDDDGCDDDDDDDDDDDEEEDVSAEEYEKFVKEGYSQDPCVLEACIKDWKEIIVNNYVTVKDACKYYNQTYMETMLDFNQNKFDALDDIDAERRALVKKHKCLAKISERSLASLGRFLQCGCKAPADRLQETKEILKDANDSITRARQETSIEVDMTEEINNHKGMMRKAFDSYTKEITSMYPKVNYSDERPTTGTGDLDMLLIQTMKTSDSRKANADIMQRDQASKAERSAKYVKVDQAKLKAAEPKAKQNMEKGAMDKTANAKKGYEDYNKKKLDAQKESITAQTAAKINAMEEAAPDRIADAVANKPPQKRGPEMEQLQKKIDELQTKLEDRATAQRESKRAQTLYSAALQLTRSLKKADRYVDISKELEIIENNAEGDKLVTTVLKTIPPEVKTKGIVPESVLKKNYKSMEDIAMKVAMLESEGAPLPMYFISWLQYKMLMKPLFQPNTVPQVELDKPPKDLTKYDTFDLLQRAGYFVEQGRVSCAMRYVDALKGASRGAAESWYRDATAHTQTRQAAEAIIAHASALNLQYI